MFEPLVVKKVLRAFDNKDVRAINTSIVQQKINPNALIPGKGVSLLHLIIGHRSENFAYKVTKLFLRCGGDPNVQSADGVTPTHVAAGWGRNQILHLLLVNGGDPWIQDDEKRNAFNYAFEEQEWSTIDMLHHFQQIHSATNFKCEYENPNIRCDLQRVLLRRGDDMFAYAPIETVKKSITTQTHNSTSQTPSPPIQEKIKYFEPNRNWTADLNCFKKPDRVMGIEQTKEIYQTSCKMLVHCKSVNNENSEDKVKKRQTFISSIRIETSQKSSESVALASEPRQKAATNSSAKDMRGQLFIELQEAVRRRSKLRISQRESTTDVNQSDSVVELNNSSRNEELPASDMKRSKADSHESEMLKNMTDIRTRNAVNEETEKTIDLCMSSPEVENVSYVSCQDDSPASKKVQTLIIPQSNSDSSTLYLTPYNSNVSSSLTTGKSKEDFSNASFTSVSEEYKYTDAEEGVVLLEKKLLVTPTVSRLVDVDQEDNSDDENASAVSSNASSLPSGMSCNSDVLRCELMGLGYNPGPITKTTKRLYLKKLWRIKRDGKNSARAVIDNETKVHSPAIKKTLRNPEEFEKIQDFRHLEEDMCRSFEKWISRKWREGTNKTSFNYLLLDPRISSNLPKRFHGMNRLDTWKCFLSSIFYVGKGKRSRPYAHLYEAAAFWQKKRHDPDDKVLRITEIWKEGLGVVCLQVFQNIIPVEAFTREAAMIEALGLSSLKNTRPGDYYGVVSTWPKRDKRNLGVYLLHKAFLIFLNEGERQIKPYDID